MVSGQAEGGESADIGMLIPALRLYHRHKIDYISGMPMDTSLADLSKDELITLVQTYSSENDKLRHFIKQMQNARFGRRSEKLDDDQLQFALEDLEQAASTEAAKDEQGEQPKREHQPRRNRGALPSHLPREDIVIPPDETACPCCGGVLHVIGEDVAEMLDIVPAQFKVKVIRRPRMGCRTCEGGVFQAPAPARPIDGGMATEALVAHVLVGKYADHLPLYRQAQIYARQGVELDRSTLADWVGRACWWLEPVSARVLASILASGKIFADDTTVPVLDPGRGRTKTGRLWAYARDDRPWQGNDPPAVAYVYSEDRKGRHPTNHLSAFKGVLQVDGYAGFDSLAAGRADGSVTLAHCWAHCRRKFHELHLSTKSPTAEEALRRIAELYAVEAEIRGQNTEARRDNRQERSRPLVDALKVWLERQLALVSGKSPLAAAIRYSLTRWGSLSVFLADGRVEMDTNTVERSIRPITLGRKNHLFAGSDGGADNWAIVATLIQTAKLNGVEPFAYLHNILTKVVDGHPINRIDELLPWNYATANAVTPAP